VSLQWSAPYSDGGSPIARYVVPEDQWEEAGRVTGAAATSFTVQRLREGTPSRAMPPSTSRRTVARLISDRALGPTAMDHLQTSDTRQSLTACLQ